MSIVVPYQVKGHIQCSSPAILAMNGNCSSDNWTDNVCQIDECWRPSISWQILVFIKDSNQGGTELMNKWKCEQDEQR